MFKVIIIDDEPMIRQGIRTMINWQEHGCEVCAEAQDGVEGLEKIKEFAPEIIITDIRMPEMDGLAMIREAKSLIPGSKVIILTGFRDFDYVYEALKIGAFGFILKPTKISELNSLITRAVTELRFAVARDEEIAKLRSLFEKNIPVLREKLLYEMMYGMKDKSGDLEGRMRLFNLNIEKFIMLLVQCEPGEEVNTLSPYDRHVYQFGVIKSFEEIFAPSFSVMSIPVNDTDSVFIINLPERAGDVNSVINDKCQQLQEMVAQCFNMVLTIAVSTVAQSSAEIHAKFNECHQALDYKHYAGSGSIIYYGDLNSFFRYDDFSDLKQIQQQLLDGVKAGNEEVTKSKLDEMSAYFKKGVKNGSDWIKSYFSSLLTEINNIRLSVIAADNERNEEISGSMESLNRMIHDAEDTESLEGILREAALRVAERINRYNNKSIKLIVKKAIEYIHENYREQLTLNDIASHVYVSPSYVSRMFGREVGKNFVDYLNEVRIEKAKELLNDVRYKTYEIADKVGIQDARYFSRLFKKYTGKTPTEYRESL
jgi:two-component system response regulator YesN